MPTNATPERPAEAEATSVNWFRRAPTGGTRYVATPPPPTPTSVNNVSSYLRQMPTGGATVFITSSDEGGDEGNE